MKCFNWRLIGLATICLAVIPLTGCTGVPSSDYEALQAEYATLVDENTSFSSALQQAQSDLTNKQADYDAVSQELTEIKEVYPPTDFSSLTELEDWLVENDVSERPVTDYASGWYRKALEIQEDALKDGYIVSADYDYDEGTDDYAMFCITIIDGDIWYWDPETDEPLQDYSLGKVK